MRRGPARRGAPQSEGRDAITLTAFVLPIMGRMQSAMGATPSKKTTAKMGAKAVLVMVRHPTLRRATVKAGTPPAKLGWRVGKVVARRKAGAQVDRIGAAGKTVAAAGKTVAAAGKTAGAAGKTAAAFLVVYGPMAAEVFGLVEPRKPRRRAQAFAAGVVAGAGAGAGAVYALNRSNRNSA